MYEHNQILPVYISKYPPRQRHIDLLLLKDGENAHYTFIKNMSALVADRTCHKGKTYVCPHCIHAFYVEQAFINHLPQCSARQQKIIFPEKGLLEFKSSGKMELCPFAIYADFESYLKPIKNELGESTHPESEHIPSGFCTYTARIYSEHKSAPIVYSDDDVIETFFDELLKE